MYCSPNYKTKKALKEAVAKGEEVSVLSPGPFPCPQEGWVALEGPHYPEPHRWYARAWVVEGKVKSIK